MRSEEIVALMDSLYVTQLNEIFAFYSNLDDPEISHEASKLASIMQAKAFTYFVQQFNIAPKILDIDTAMIIFKNLVKNKRMYGKDNIRGLTREDFTEALLRICILGKHNLGVEVNEEVNKFDITGIKVDTVEMFLKTLGLTPGEKKEPILQILRSIKDEGVNLIDKINKEPI